MKKTALIIVLIFALTLPAFAGCGKADFNRSAAAAAVVTEFGFTGSDKRPRDIASDKNAEAIRICASRNIFGKAGRDYYFRPGDKLTRYELAKISVMLYAALLCVEDENLVPGGKREIADISALEPEQKWYVFCALDNGFVSLDSSDKFYPEKIASKADFDEVLAKVKVKAGKTGTDLPTYKTNKLKNFKTAPHSDAPVADYLYVFDAPNAPYNTVGTSPIRLAAASLQGIVNRDKIQLYVAYETYHWMASNGAQYGQIFDYEPDLFNGYTAISDWAIDFGYHKGYANGGVKIPGEDGPEALFTVFKDYIKKAVVWDIYNRFTINAAVNIANVEGAIIITQSQVDMVKRICPDVEIIDIIERFENHYEAQLWTYHNCFPHLRRDIIGFNSFLQTSDWQRDYIIQMRIPTLWTPGDQDTVNYDIRTVNLVNGIMESFPANIPIYGTTAAWTAGIEYGLGEVQGVYTCGVYGKYTAPNDAVGNLSWQTGLKVPVEKMKFKNYNRVTEGELTYDSSKKYFAVAMVESGDAPAYMQYGFYWYQWAQKERGNVAYSYAVAPVNADLGPLLTQKWVETQSPKDYFYTSVGGLGYMYPFSFGDKGVITEDGVYMERDEIMADHYRKVNEMCVRHGYEATQLYSFNTGTFWQDFHYEELERHVAAHMPDVNIIVADVHRQSNPPLPAGGLVKELTGGQRVWHCTTRWNAFNYGDDWVGNLPSAMAAEEAAVNWLAKEIMDNSDHIDANFFYGMAYSWHYGPRRVEKVMNKIIAEAQSDYVFVTIGELDSLYLQATRG